MLNKWRLIRKLNRKFNKIDGGWNCKIPGTIILNGKYESESINFKMIYIYIEDKLIYFRENGNEDCFYIDNIKNIEIHFEEKLRCELDEK